MSQLPQPEFIAAMDSAVRELVGVDYRSGLAFVSLPLLYPSGWPAVVRVSEGSPSYLVTDFGAGYDEAKMLGGEAAKVYARHARSIADLAGIKFDSEAFFALEASADPAA